MRLQNVLLGLCIVVPLLLAAAVLWRDSEEQYVAMTNLGLRLRVLHQSELDRGQFSQKNWSSWEMVWRPMVVAMQFEAKQAVLRKQGFHLSRPMYEQLSRFAEANIDDEPDLMKLLNQLNFSGDVVEAKAPFVFSEHEQITSLATVTGFHNEVSAILSSESAYSDWLSPILQQQKSLDRSTTCKTLMGLKAFQAYSDRLNSKCAAETKKWAVCGGVNESLTRQMKELQVSSESNLNKYKSRWFVENMNDLCSDI